MGQGGVDRPAGFRRDDRLDDYSDGGGAQMTQNERIETIREVFPGYTKPLDSMCKKPEYYGIRRTAEAEAIIADKPRRKREANYKLSVRIPLGYVNMAEFRQQLIEMGYCNFTAWVLRCIRRQQEEYRHRKAPTGSAKANEGKGRLSTTNIQDLGRNVK